MLADFHASAYVHALTFLHASACMRLLACMQFDALEGTAALKEKGAGSRGASEKVTPAAAEAVLVQCRIAVVPEVQLYMARDSAAHCPHRSGVVNSVFEHLMPARSALSQTESVLLPASCLQPHLGTSVCSASTSA